MRTLKLIEFVYLASYVIISSQLIYYLLVMSDALKLISIDNFMELRKTIDPIFKKRLSFVYYACLSLNIVLLVMRRGDLFSISYAALIVAFLCLVADLLIAIKGNIPVNNHITNYVSGSIEYNWHALRKDWLNYITWRGIANFIGMLSLIAGMLVART